MMPTTYFGYVTLRLDLTIYPGALHSQIALLAIRTDTNWTHSGGSTITYIAGGAG